MLSDAERRKEYDEARALFGAGGRRFRAPGGAGGRAAATFDLGDLFGGGAPAAGGLGDLLGGLFGQRSGGAAAPPPRGAAPTSSPR